MKLWFEKHRAVTEVKLYNVLFPVWMLLMFPAAWLIVLPGNFLLDSLVLAVGMALMKIGDRKQLYKKCILKIYCFGLLSDVIGSAYMIVMMTVFQLGRMGDELYLTLPALALSSVLIFVLNYFFTFKTLEVRQRVILSLIFAVITAPYTFLLPSSLLYGN